MAILGKRKASEPKISPEEAEEIFRRHFEAQFAPIDIPEKKKDAPVGLEDDDEDDERVGEQDSDDEEWGGVSGDDEEEDQDDEDDNDGVEVVDHSKQQMSKPVAMSKAELKRFMSSRIPDQTEAPKEISEVKTSTTKTLPEDAPSLLAQDLELRRLLAESHLLATPSLTSNVIEPKAFASGKIRQKATDLRVQALGSKDSILKQQSMPMAMRKGIIAASEGREKKRRREAKENGVILEREVKKEKRRDRRGGEVDRPGMGSFRGAELRLSDRDVKSIEGSRDTFGRRSRGGGGGKRR